MSLLAAEHGRNREWREAKTSVRKPPVQEVPLPPPAPPASAPPVPDAAYNDILKARRQQRRQKIAAGLGMQDANATSQFQVQLPSQFQGQTGSGDGVGASGGGAVPGVPETAASPLSAHRQRQPGPLAQDANAPAISRPPADGVSKASVRWLCLLFTETAILLALQICAGSITQSLALLADVGHSAADVIGYGINFWVERRKLITAQNRDSLSSGEEEEAALSHERVDLLGCFLSTALLCVATVLASKEAIERLVGKDGDDEYEAVGPALLGFAVVSTLANTGTLFLFKYWKKQEARQIATSRDQEMETYQAPSLGSGNPNAPPEVPGSPPPGGAPDPFAEMMCQPCEAPFSLRNSFSAGRCTDAGCTDASCGGGGEANAGPLSTWQGVLHMLVHPGCDGNHGGPAQDTRSSPADEENNLAASDAPTSRVLANLNVSAALLHLVTDVLRGFTILVTAILIEAKVVKDAGRADAICALVVAALVGLGSVALIQKMCSASRSSLVALSAYCSPSSSARCFSLRRASASTSQTPTDVPSTDQTVSTSGPSPVGDV